MFGFSLARCCKFFPIHSISDIFFFALLSLLLSDAHIALPPLPEDEVISIPENHIPITIDQPIVEPIVEPIAASSSTAQTSSSSRHLIFIAIGAAGVCAAVALVIGAVVVIRRHRAERARYSLLDNEI